MEIVDEARKHGFGDEDIWHGLRNPLLIHNFDGYDMIIGPALDGNPLEIGVSYERGIIFHCDIARAKFLRIKPKR